MEQRGEDSPAGIQLVITNEVGVITLQGVKDEGFIRLWDLEVGEAAAVGQVELSDNGLHAQARELRVHLDVHTLVGLDAHDELVPRDVLEDARGDILELDSDLGLLLVESLAGLQDEGHALPTLVLDKCHHGAEGGTPRILGHGIVLLVRWPGSIQRLAVLADNHVLRLDSGDAAENTDLFVSDVLRGERDWALHSQEGQDLEQMVLHNITDDTELVKVPPTALSAKRLLEGDLHVVDVIPVPGRAEELVTKSQDQDILHHLLAQVMVNAEDLLLVPVWLQRLLQLPGAGQILSEWLLDL